MSEGQIVNKDDLILEWDRALNFYDDLIENNHKLRPIRFIIRHIIEKGYNKALFPGTSLYSLLISIPQDNKVNYNNTLQIQYDELRELLKFRFTDKTGLGRQPQDGKESLRWEETCQLTEGIALLETFFSENKDFKNKITEN
jgi:hypothetical protein